MSIPRHSGDNLRQETLSPEAAAKALQGFMPFEHFEPDKNERYREFLRLVSSRMDTSRFEKEQQEFVRTGQIFQPLHGFMAEKFVNPKNQASSIDFGKTEPHTFSTHKGGSRKKIDWSAFPILKKRFDVEQEDIPKNTHQPVESNHNLEESHDPLPERPAMAFLREIYSPEFIKKSDKVVFRKPQPKSATNAKS